MSKRLKLIYGSFLGAFVSFLAHNMVFGIVKIEEWFFFGLFFLLMAGFILLLLYSVMEFIIDREPADLWKVGFLGWFGIMGIFPGFTTLFAFFGLFGLFGLKDYF
ncbi:MAG: hypothetical protein PHD31_00260 [Candidatus Pacebacteria bacterium]|nr:hypothetical protein [Candidatus Paceibacterota bacterium]